MSRPGEEQASLFDLPAEPARVIPTRRKSDTGKVKYAPYRGAHQPCGDCVRELYAAGGWTGRPAPASTRRTGPGGVHLLCSSHASKRRESERP